MSDHASELDDIKGQALALGRRLGLLLATAQLPDEQKEAWVALIPSMTPQQMADLAEALEGLVPDAEEQGFAELANQLKAGETRFAARVATATADAKTALDAVESEL
jgi:hypothetical protein